MKFIWKCSTGHVVKKKNAERRDTTAGEKRWYMFCVRCGSVKPISKQMVKDAK